MSRKVSARPSFRNHSKLLRWIAIRSGQLERLGEVGERIALTGRRDERPRLTPQLRCGWGGDGSRGAPNDAANWAEGQADARQPAILPRGDAQRQPLRLMPRRDAEAVGVEG